MFLIVGCMVKKESPKVHFQILKHLVGHCELLKLDRKEILNMAGVDEKFLNSNISYISLEMAEKIVRNLYQKLDYETTLLDLFTQNDALVLGALELLMTLSSDLNEAIIVFLKYREINGDLEKLVEIRVCENDLILRWETSSKDSYIMRAVVECQTAWWGAFIRLIGRNKTQFIQNVCYTHDIKSLEVKRRYNSFFGCPVVFNQEETRLVFSKNALKVPLQTANRDLFLVIENYIKGSLLTIKSDEKAVDKVRALIYLKLQKGTISRELIAETMGITVRTMTRRLSAEGSSYSEILEEVRFDVAKNYLERTDHSVIYIAQAIGFFKSSTFITWFKSLAGITPKKYRDNSKLI